MMQTAEQLSTELRTRGQARKRDQQLLAMLAFLSFADVARVDSTWDRLAPRAYRGLTAAPNATPLSAPASHFWYNPGTAQYGHGTRGYVQASGIRHALNVFNANHAAELAKMTAAAGRGEMSVPAWQDAMTQGIKDAQVVNAAVGKGGSLALTDGDLTLLSPTLEYQFGRLDRFAGQLAGGRISTVEVAGNRAGAYAKSAVTAWDGMRRRAADVAGYTFERNVLGSAEHCEHDPLRPHIPDCPSLTEAGWVSIGTLPPIGTRLCVWCCVCAIIFSRGGSVPAPTP